MTLEQIETGKQLDHDILNLLLNASIDDKKELLDLLKTQQSLIWSEKIGEVNSQINEQIQHILQNTSWYKLLRPNWSDNYFDSLELREFFKKYIQIGITEKELKSSDDLQEPSEFDDFIPENQRYWKNYKSWLGKKLFLSKDEIEKKTIHDIDNIAKKYLNYAIQHIGKYLDNFSPEEQKLLKSEYYSQIHNGDSDKTVFNMLRFWNDLRLRRNQLMKEQQTNPRKWINYDNVLRQIKIWLFEIQRILSLALLYIDREKNQNYQHTREDIDFLVKKLSDIVINEKVEDHILDQENPLYHITNSQKYFWKKDEDGSYILSEEKIENTEPITLEGITIKWKKTSEIKVYHTGARMKKWPFSSVDKFVRKNYTSFDQIMDQKWFIFVVDTNDMWKLKKILQDELSTGETWWIDSPVFMKNSGNENTSSHYNSLKWTLKVPYKWKLLKDFFELLEQHFKTHTELIRRIKLVKDKCTQEKTPTIAQIEMLLAKNFWESEFVKTLFKDLKSKFKNKEYNIEVEIQIFDIHNYMKAEVDESSPAHHNYYKDRQVVDTIPKYLPPSVYGEEITSWLVSKRLTKK